MYFLFFYIEKFDLQDIAMVSPVFLAGAGSVAMAAAATRPSDVSVCDYYSTALFNVSNATTQLTLITAVVNTAVIGNYTTPNLIAVPGILAADATYNGTKVNLLKYFDGSLFSTNTGGDHGATVSFLDGGGAKPLAESMPATGKHSKQ